MQSIRFPGDETFVTHPEYPRLMAGAHRRRVTPLAAPSLVRNLAFWNPLAATPDSGAGAAVGSRGEAYDSRAAQADSCIADVYRWLLGKAGSGSGISAVDTDSRLTVSGKAIIVLLSSVIDRKSGMPVATPAHVAPDSYRAVKLSFLWHGLSTTLSFELHTEFLVMTMIIDLSKGKSPAAIALARRVYGRTFCEVQDGLSAFAAIDQASATECRALYKFLYETLWTRFAREVLVPLKRHQKSLGPKFADFRGIVLGAQGSRKKVEVVPPFAGAKGQSGTGKERYSLCRMKEFDTLWQFITCVQKSDTEFTISRFLKGRAFYATALGSQSRIVVEGVGKPLFYLLYEDTINAWQLGRLIYRVHRAGAARIAAIMHFEELRKANKHLTQIEDQLEKANAELGETSETESAGLRTSLRDLYEKVEEELGFIAKLDWDGTLEARIERSRYYVRQFANVAAALRIRRVDGFQPYDEFVLQRMGPAFDYIDAVGRKYARVQTDRSILLNRIQTLDSQYNEEIVSRAQHIADFALSCVLIPYYAGSVVADALPKYEHYIRVVALSFGLIMLVMLRYLPPVWKSVFGRSVPSFLLRLANRFLIAFVLALLAASVVSLSLGKGWLFLPGHGPDSKAELANAPAPPRERPLPPPTAKPASPAAQVARKSR